jgi:hypothetical protein
MPDYPPNPYSQTSSYDRPGPKHAYQELKHSGFGIISFVLSLLCGLGMIVLIVAAVLMESENLPEDSPQLMLLGFGVIGIGLSELFAAIFGFVALFQPDRKKIFAILGLVFSIGAILLFGGLVILGLMVGG